MDNLAVGVLFDFSTSSTGDFSSTSTSLGPLVRYYIQNVFLSAAYQHSFIRTNNDGDKDSDNGGIFSAQLGYALFVNDFVAIEPSLGYTTGVGDLFDEFNGFGLNVDFALYF